MLSGKIAACEFVKQACKRQRDDLKRKRFAYTFDAAKAERVCRFIEALPHVKGSQWAGKKIALEPWQCFVLTTIFGWVDKEGMRRFSKAYIEVPRKNAKTTLAAGVALFCQTSDGEMSAEVVSAASKAAQAKIVLDIARQMVKREPMMRERLGLTVYEHSIFREADAASFKSLSKDNQGSQDGLNIHCGIVDELHAHKSRDMLAAIDTATGSRAQPLLFIITTAGVDRTGICYEERDYIKTILNGQDDDRVFGIIYTIDEDDDWTDPCVWAKANPNYGVSVSPTDLERKATKAQRVASAQNEFLTKHLNVWVNASTAWLNINKWDACANDALDIDDFKGLPCWIGLDLASKKDITAKAYIFKRDGKFVLFVKHYLPESAVEDGENEEYNGWAKDGWLTVTDGNVADLPRIGDDIAADAAAFDVQSVMYDPWNATELAVRLLEQGAPMVECRMSARNLSEPMKLLEALVIDRKIEHNGDPVLAWQISNVVCKVDANDNIFPRKEFPEKKIDAAVASIMALAGAIKTEEAGPSALEQLGGVLYV